MLDVVPLANQEDQSDNGPRNPREERDESSETLDVATRFVWFQTGEGAQAPENRHHDGADAPREQPDGQREVELTLDDDDTVVVAVVSTVVVVVFVQHTGSLALSASDGRRRSFEIMVHAVVAARRRGHEMLVLVGVVVVALTIESGSTGQIVVGSNRKGGNAGREKEEANAPCPDAGCCNLAGHGGDSGTLGGDCFSYVANQR